MATVRGRGVGLAGQSPSPSQLWEAFVGDRILRQAKELANRYGWRYVRRARHGFVFEREGQFTSMSTSPGDMRAIRNFEARLRRDQ
jgi:hypothetical protein